MEDQPSLSRTEKKGLLLFSGCIAAFGLFWSVAALEVPERTAFSSISPGLLPFWAGLFLAFMGAVLFISTWRRPALDDAVPGAESLFTARGMARVAAALAVLLGYILLLEKLHYAITTYLVILLGLVVAGEPVRLRLFVVSAGIAGALFLIFVYWLGVPLPGSRYF